MLKLINKILREFTPVPFDDLVRHYYTPIVGRAGLSLRQLSRGVFEIPGEKFSIRIRDAVGHSTDFMVTLLPFDCRSSNLEEEFRGEIGLRVIADFYGEPLKESDLFTPGRFQRHFAKSAESAEKLLIPYVLGERNDLDAINHFIERKIVDSGIRWKKYKFGTDVLQKWK